MAETLRKTHVDWIRTFEHPIAFIAGHEDSVLKIRINESPALPVYTLLVDDKETESFDVWPIRWRLK